MRKLEKWNLISEIIKQLINVNHLLSTFQLRPFATEYGAPLNLPDTRDFTANPRDLTSHPATRNAKTLTFPALYSHHNA